MNKEIYDIYRACRLCGAGAGYKMPIIQSIIGVDEDDEETDLEQKIKECVEIEVSLQDRMPPLICELCVDKIHDFFEFRKICQETNRITRLKLGLPLQVKKAPCLKPGLPLQVKMATVPESNLGVTETLTIDSDDGEPLSRQRTSTQKPQPKSSKIKKENELHKDEKTAVIYRSRSPSIELIEKRETRSKRAPSPKRTTRQTKTEEGTLSYLQDENTAVIYRSRSPSIELIEKRETRSKRAPSPKRTTRQTKTEEGTLSYLQGLQIAEATSPASKIRPAPKSKRDRERRAEPEKETEIEESADDNSLLVPRNKRAREVVLEMPLPVKRTKLVPTPPPKPERPKAGPKSSKEAVTPTPPRTTKACPSSKKIEVTPKSQKPEQPIATKSKKTETLDSTPKSKNTQPVKSKLEVFPKPGPKSRKVESLVDTTPTPKGKKREDPSPGPKSKRQREVSPQVVRALSPAKSFECSICSHSTKSSKGLNLHLKTHVPAYTAPELACNACEQWFANAMAANTHVRLHTIKGLAYTCTKCYDVFKTANDYEMHFTRNQCLQTYEVPDVKCEECWKMFPTYKLLEDHKCLGKGARPGGKCPKCKRLYASQKSLVTHEIRCTVGRKRERAVEPQPEAPLEPKVDPDVSNRILPMQVRLVRCDTLLAASHDGQYDVKGISHRFGLDRNRSYPYLYSMGDIKVEPATTFDPMVNIQDDIKQEYTEDSFIHWDSDKESDDDDLLSSPKSLSTISLKTLFSPKCLGKVPKKKRRVKTEKGFDSVLSIGFNLDAKRNIDHLIDSLSNSDTYDSDSILDKGSDKKDNGNDIFETLNDNIISSIENHDDGVVKPEEMEKSHEDIDKSDTDDRANDVNVNSKNFTQNDNNDHRINKFDRMDDEKINDVDDLEMNIDTENKFQDDNKDNRISEFDKIDDTQANTDSNDVTNDNIARIEESKSVNLPQSIDSKVIESNDESSREIIEDNANQNSSNTTSPKNGHVVSIKLIQKEDHANTEINEQNVEKSISNDEQDKISLSNDSQSSQINDTTENSNNVRAQSQINENNDSSDTNTDLLFEVQKDKSNNDQNSNLNNENQDCSFTTNVEENVKSYENNVSMDQSNVISNEIYDSNAQDNLTNHSNITDNEISHLDSSKNEQTSKNEETAKPNISEESLITESDLFDTKSLKSVDKFNINNLDEEDKLLMEQLDAQIGEIKSENNAIKQNDSQRDAIVDISNKNDKNNASHENYDVIGQNSGVINQNSDVIGQHSNVIGQNRDVISSVNSENTENKSANFGTSESLVSNKYSIAAILNEGFGEDKQETLDELIDKQDNLRSLDLDSISDDDFNFDI